MDISKKDITRLASFPEQNPNPVMEISLNGDVTYSNSASKKYFHDLHDKGISHPVFSFIKNKLKQPETVDFKNFKTEVTVGDRIFEQKLYFLKENNEHFLKKSALLMIRPLKKITLLRFMFGFLGGVVLPLTFLSLVNTEISRWIFLTGMLTIFVFLFIGEFLERYLFFRSVVSLKMPGGKAS